MPRPVAHLFAAKISWPPGMVCRVKEKAGGCRIAHQPSLFDRRCPSIAPLEKRPQRLNRSGEWQKVMNHLENIGGV
jgi:hypothetical protein